MIIRRQLLTKDQTQTGNRPFKKETFVVTKILVRRIKD